MKVNICNSNTHINDGKLIKLFIDSVYMKIYVFYISVE